MKYMLLLVTLLIVSCAKSTVEVNGKFELPQGLQDCQVYEMTSGGALTEAITVVRCPLSQTSTTFRVGKTTHTAACVEADTTGMGEYTRLKKKFEGN